MNHTKQAQREAAPSTIAADGLTQEQRKAAKQVLELIQSLAEHMDGDKNCVPQKDKWDTVLPVLHQKKFNQVILIDGRRGSGKTTVLLTLLELWSQHHRGNKQAANKIIDNKAEFNDIIKPAIPLGLIHLSALPRSANLMVHVASIFRPVLNLLEDSDGRPYYQPAREELKARKLWTEFMRVAATAWDGHLNERRRDMDADSYAIELEETEVRRLHLRQSFHDFIDALHEDAVFLFKQEGMPQTPLWIIPIDDADVNPQCTIQLLDLLRILWHPQVVFLLTGETALFLRILRGYVFDNIVSSRLHPTSARCGSNIAGDEKLANRLADDIYLKLVPIEHRCHIPELELAERLKHMKGDLAKMRFPLDPLRNEQEPLKESLDRVFCTVPQTRYALPRRMRTIVTLRAEIKSILAKEKNNNKEKNYDAVFEFVKERWQYYVESSDHNEEEKATLGRLITRSRDNAPTVDHRGKVHFWPTRAILSDGSLLSRNPSILLREYTGFNAWFDSEHKRPVSEEVVAVLLIALSVFPFSSHYEVPTGRLCAESINAAYVQIGHAANSIGLDGTQTLWLGWPMPDWESPYLWLTLSDLWRKQVDTLKKLSPQPTIKDLAIRYLDVVLKLIRYPEERKKDNKRANRPDFSVINQILSVVEAQQGRRGPSPRHLASYEWALRMLALLAMPESGLPHEFANEIANMIQKHIHESDDKNSYSKEKAEKFPYELEENRRLRIKIMLESSSYTNGDVNRSIDKIFDHFDSENYAKFEWKRIFKLKKVDHQKAPPRSRTARPTRG